MRTSLHWPRDLFTLTFEWFNCEVTNVRLLNLVDAVGGKATVCFSFI